MGDEAALLFKAMSTSKIGHCASQRSKGKREACSECCGFGKDCTKVSMQWDRLQWNPGDRTVSGSVKYFVEMLMEAEAHQESSLKQHRMNHKEGIAAAANFLTELDGWGGRNDAYDACAGQVSTSYFLPKRSRFVDCKKNLS
jgi:hypothetical protein